MKLTPRYRTDAGFSLASMTDMTFLMLLFFMLTASYAIPSAIAVQLPAAQSAQQTTPADVRVSVDIHLQCTLNDTPIDFGQIPAQLAKCLSPGGSLILELDERLPIERMVQLADAAAAAKAHVVIATRPKP